MKHTIAFSAVAALAVFGSAGVATAACSTSITPITDGISVDVNGCHLQIQNPPVVPIAVSPSNPGDPSPGSAGVEIVVRRTSDGEVGSDGGVIIDTINQNMHSIVQKNASQDSDIATNSIAINANAADIGSLEDLTADHSAQLATHASTLSAHDDKLDDHAKGLAISMAMPDAWLSASKNFGVFGSFGGFADETAVGFAAIGRIDQTFSLNAKLGADTSFDQFGWQVGAGAQW